MLLDEEHEGPAAEALPLKEDVLLLRELPRGGLEHNSKEIFWLEKSIEFWL